MPWRLDDELLLQRLEDEAVAERPFLHRVGRLAAGAGAAGFTAPALHPRASGIVAELRRAPGGGAEVGAALDGDIARLAVLLDRLAFDRCRPELLHHLALFHAKTAEALSQAFPEVAA